MIVGLYLLIPIISPWVERASDREIISFLVLWGVTLLVPYGRRFQPQLLGEAHWNLISTTYYFTGYIGYLVLGHFLVHRRPRRVSGRRSIAAAILAVMGYAITVIGFLHTLPNATTIPEMELFWQFDTLNVAAMTASIFELGLAVTGINPIAFRIITRFSAASYAVYLAHIFILNELFQRLGQGRSPWIVVPLQAAGTALLTYLLVSAAARIPKAGVWIGFAPQKPKATFSG